MNLIHIIIPTLNRAEKLEDAVASCVTASKNVNANVYIFVYYSNVEEYNRDLDRFSKYSNVLLRLLNFEYKAPDFWNSHLKNYKADAYIYLNDDVVLLSEAIERSIVLMEKYYPNLDGLIAFKQVNLPPNQCCKAAFGMIGTELANKFPNRKVWCEDYYRFYADAELELFTKKMGLLYYTDNETEMPLLIHRHPAFDIAAMDSTHVKVRKYLQKDKTIFINRRNKGVIYGESSI